jgi:transcriptional regulator GlxA family with amidase domain
MHMPVSATGRPPRRVLIIAPSPAQILDLAGPAEVFAQAGRLVESPPGNAAPPYRVEVVIAPGPAQAAHATTSGIQLAPGRSLVELTADPAPLDTLIIGGGEGARLHGDAPELCATVRELAGRARRVASVCTGAYVLAAAGLLDGKRATTHWRWCQHLARRYPLIHVEPEPIFVQDGAMWTSAGVTAGIDLALALVEADHGHALALAIARELVMFLRRPGGQKQFSATLSAQDTPGTTMRDLVAWMADNLQQKLTVDSLAARTRFSPRQFARVFAHELGVTPGDMVDRLRIEAARRQLEDTRQGLAAIAGSCGFGSEEVMRRTFVRHVGVPPGAYRDRFRGPSAPASSYNQQGH